MAKIIKNTEDQSVERVSFDPLDTEGYKPIPPGLSIEQQVATILADARAEAEKKIQEAYQEGFELGIQKGREQYLESVAHSLQTIRQAAVETQLAIEKLRKEFEQQVFVVSREIVKKILQREAQLDPESIRRIIRVVLEHLADRQKLIIRAHPSDLAILKKEGENLFADFPGILIVDFKEDNEITPGGCIVETETAWVDARIETQVARLLDAIWEIPHESQRA